MNINLLRERYAAYEQRRHAHGTVRTKDGRIFSKSTAHRDFDPKNPTANLSDDRSTKRLPPETNEFNRLMVLAPKDLQTLPNEVRKHFACVERDHGTFMYRDEPVRARHPKIILLTLGKLSWDQMATCPKIGDPMRRQYLDSIEEAEKMAVLWKHYGRTIKTRYGTKEVLMIEDENGNLRRLRMGDTVEIPIGSNEDLDDLYGEEVEDHSRDDDAGEQRNIDREQGSRSLVEESIRENDGFWFDPEKAGCVSPLTSWVAKVDQWVERNRNHPLIAELDDLQLHRWIMAQATAAREDCLKPHWVPLKIFKGKGSVREDPFHYARLARE